MRSICGFDSLALKPTADISANEIAAAKSVQLAEHNAMSMRTYSWTPSFTVVKAHVDQVTRAGGIKANKLANVTKMLERAEASAASNPSNAKAQLQAAANQLDTKDAWQAKLHAAIQNLMATMA
jgi:hypothetical protein